MCDRPVIGRNLFLSVFLLLTSYSGAAVVLEEVVVTAQVRAQSLQDVPVSVNAVSGDKMQEAGLDKIEDLQAYVPNLTMSETGIGTNIYIRGIGSGINQGFEQSVGMYFDGVYYGRAQLSRAPFLDLERVEVLRGPQNILYGKNSIAGALSLISRRPGQEFEGYGSVLYEPDHGERVVDLVLSGALTDTMGGRLAIRHKSVDGYIENLTLDRDEPSRQETSIRLMLDWAFSDTTNILTKLEFGKFDVTGRQIEITNEGPSRRNIPGPNGTLGRTYASILDNTVAGSGTTPSGFTYDEDASVLNNTLDYKRSSNGDFSNNDTENLTISIDRALDNGGSLTFITGLLHYRFEEDCDCDFTGGDVFNVVSEEEYTQVSQEFRYVSPVGETWEFITGGYLQASDLNFFDSIIVDSRILPDLINFGDFAAGGQLGDPVTPGFAGDSIAFLGTPRVFEGETNLASVFIQATWNMTDTLRATFGARYTYEDKQASRSLQLTDFRTGELKNSDETDITVARNFKAEAHDLEGNRTESQFSPQINLQWEATDELMAYVTLSQGFKSGGFDARSNATPSAVDGVNDPLNAGTLSLEGAFEFEEEKALSLEIGAKSSLLEGSLEFNAAFFYTQYSDLQVSIFDGTLGFNVGNAAEAVTMGVEFDGRWALSESIMMTYALAFMDFEFQDFEDGQCFQNQTPDSPNNNLSDPNGARLCDYSGNTNQYVSDYSGNIGFVYTASFSDNLEFRAGVDVVFTGAYNPTQNLDPRVEQDAFQEINARFSLSNVESGWEVALVGKNLTDELVRTYQNDTPLANSIFEAESYYAFIKRPLSVALSVNYRWY